MEETEVIITIKGKQGVGKTILLRYLTAILRAAGLTVAMLPEQEIMRVSGRIIDKLGAP